MKTIHIFAASLLAAASGAQALTIDFGSSGKPRFCSAMTDGTGPTVNCGNGGYISQSFGDVAGVADVTYSLPRLTSPTSLRWWDTGFNTLYGVAWADGSDANSQARIEIKALAPGQAVTLTSFDLGAYFNASRATTVNVYAIGSTTALFSFSGLVGTSNGPATTFNPNITVAGGLWLEFKDSAYNVAIDNINYSVTAAPVPEPASVVMMLAGVGGLLVARRRAARAAG
jgi:PEP-CTERM motif